MNGIIQSSFSCGISERNLCLEGQVTDLMKPKLPISTGIGFLNHMLDQFNSHAQIGISVFVQEEAQSAAANAHDADHHHDDDSADQNYLFEKVDQTTLFAQVGTFLGAEFHRILSENNISQGTASSFGCPLDEALVLVQLERTDYDTPGSLSEYNLEPYGTFPPVTGRSNLGKMKLGPLKDSFWQQLAEKAHLNVKFQKIRGDNSHHIVEAAFKAFSRALRNLVDGVDTAAATNNKLDQLYGPNSDNFKASLDLKRHATVQRKTKETSIHAELCLDGGTTGVAVSMGLRLLDSFWTTVHKEAHASCQVLCQGDLWIDEHHTAEDVAIALGQVWNTALGDKAGLNRMWSSVVETNTAKVHVILDLSNRPMLMHNLPLTQHQTSDCLQDVPVEMLEHVLDSFVVNARMTLQIYVQKNKEKEPTLEDAWDGLAVALGRALRFAILVDQRRAGATASSKGTLAV